MEPLVSTEWLEQNLAAGDLRIVDCTVVMRPTEDGGYTFVGGADEYAAGHIPGSVFVDVLGELADKDSQLPMMLPSAEAFAAVIGGLGIGDGTRVVLYDRSNHAWAARVWWMLRVYGFSDASVLDGGWNKWLAEERPQSTEPGSYPATEFVPRLQSSLMAGKLEVSAAIGDSEVTIINSLSPEEHRGEKSNFARAGRIPGSVNVFCQHLVDPENHAYLPLEQLRQAYAGVGAATDRRTITYCGAGIAASSNALVLTALGYDDVAIYDGSMAEWTADPDSPLETG